MSKCWNENPDDRPNCHTLKEMLYEILCFERMSPVRIEYLTKFTSLKKTHANECSTSQLDKAIAQF